MTQQEQRIVSQFHAGRPGSFDALYEEYGQRVYRFCRRLTPTMSDAEDLTQDVFVAAYTGRERFAGRSSITTWLLRIAVFRWRANGRRRKIETVALADCGSSEPEQADHAGREVIRIALARALETLPSDQREAFLLVRGEGLTCREAAEILAVPEGTLKFRVCRAAERLQRALVEPSTKTETSMTLDGKVSQI